MKKVSASTLRRKKNKWQRLIGLGEWNIKIKYPSNKDLAKKIIQEHDLAIMTDCNNKYMTATIIISNNYNLYCNEKKLENIDTIIIHELIHIILDEKVEELARHIQENPKVKVLEEMVCDTFAEIIYLLKKD